MSRTARLSLRRSKGVGGGGSCSGRGGESALVAVAAVARRERRENKLRQRGGGGGPGSVGDTPPACRDDSARLDWLRDANALPALAGRHEQCRRFRSGQSALSQVPPVSDLSSLNIPSKLANLWLAAYVSDMAPNSGVASSHTNSA